MEKVDIAIIGGGLSGLTAAYYLENEGFSPIILEAEESIGGRLKTDYHNGYKLDHGFQVYLSDYPEGMKILDYDSLNLHPFKPGAIVVNESGLHRISDPVRMPGSLLSTVFSRLGSFSDKLKILRLKKFLSNKSIDEIFNTSDTDTYTYLKDFGFSQKMISNFFQPFFSGIFLENRLETSSRMFEFVYKMFAEGDATLPEKGISAIPLHMAEKLNKTKINLNHKVKSIDGKTIICEGDRRFEANKILISTPPNNLLKQLIPSINFAGHGVTNIYFSTDKPPTKYNMIMLNACKEKLINNLCIPTNVTESYAPRGKALISISINGNIDVNDELLLNIKNEMSQWFGAAANQWEYLRHYNINYALPNNNVCKNTLDLKDLTIKEDIYKTGDYLLNGSINAAMKSGRLAAEILSE